jgi:hypothetical protein
MWRFCPRYRTLQNRSLTLWSAETSNCSHDALIQPVFVMQAAQDLLHSDLAFPLQSVPVYLG